MGNHALDGLIARAVSLLGLCLLLSPLVRDALHASSLAGSRRTIGWVAFALGCAGALIQLNAYVLSLADFGYDEPSVWRPELAEFGRWLGPALRETQFGRWWCAHAGTLGLTLVVILRAAPSPRLIAVVSTFWILTFVRLGHAAGYPLVSAAFLSQLVHTAAVVGWLSGLLGLTTLVLDESHPLQRQPLRRFAQVMLSLMLVIVTTGAVRLVGLHDAAVTPWRSSLYLWILAAKLLLVALILVAAATARRRILAGGGSAVSPAALRQVLSVEVLTASLVLFISTLLSQVPSP